MSISIISAIKDREDHFLQSYKSWLSCDDINEVVVVDWGSERPISEIVEKDDRLRIIQVNKEHCNYWAFSQAFNLAARFASSTSFVVMNADEVLVEPSQICSIPAPTDKFYYEGTSWDSEKAHGVYFLYVSESLFWSVNGYHEDLIGYGYEDVDLRKRLEKKGAELKACDIKIQHIKHDASHASRENMLNYATSYAYPWKTGVPLISIKSIKESGNVIYCDIEESDQITYEKMLERKGRARALSGLFKIHNMINGV
tara:strand:+ start:319 stop:1086 length:768 start_codon:yes stop_codon:yes gene_type:complete